VQSRRRHFELQEENVELTNSFPSLTQSTSLNPNFTCKLQNSYNVRLEIPCVSCVVQDALVSVKMKVNYKLCSFLNFKRLLRKVILNYSRCSSKRRKNQSKVKLKTMVAAQLGVLADATNKVRLVKLTFVLGVLISILLWPAIVGSAVFLCCSVGSGYKL